MIDKLGGTLNDWFTNSPKYKDLDPERTKLVFKIGSYYAYTETRAPYFADGNLNVELYIVDPADRDGAVGRTVMFVDLEYVKNQFYEVGTVEIHEKYRGVPGFASRVYAEIVKNLGPLRSGCCQTNGGQSIWNGLAERDDVAVIGFYKESRTKVLADLAEATDFSELECYDFDVYDDNEDDDWDKVTPDTALMCIAV